MALVFIFTFGATHGAYAEAGASDAFEMVFPTANYFQSEQPTLVAANENFLTVYDSAQNRLYVREIGLSTYYYDLSAILTLPSAGGEEDDDSPTQKAVAGIYTVGTHAIIAVEDDPDFEIYSIDLKDASATPEKKELPSPERVYCFASDGERLYAKNAAGDITIYDEEMSVVNDEIYNDALAGKASIACDGENIYLFPTVQGVAHLYIYDVAENELSLDIESKLVSTAYIGDVIYAQISSAEDINNSNKIICLDKETGEELYTSNFMPESFCAYKDKLYSISGGKVTGYRLKNTSEDEDVTYVLEPEETLSMAGSDFMHLNNPDDVVFTDGALIVADRDNSRLAYIDTTSPSASVVPYQLDSKPVRVTCDTNKVYALLQSGAIVCFEIEDGALLPQNDVYTPEEGEPEFNDIVCFHSYLYAIDDEALYIRIVGKFDKIADISGAKRLTFADGGRCLYALTDDGIVMTDENGEILPSRSTGDFSDAVDIAADYAGNVFIMYPDRAEYYHNDIYSLKKTSTHALAPSTYNATATSCALIGDVVYFSAEQSLIGKFNVNAVTHEGYVPPALPVLKEDSTYHFAKLKEGTSSYFIPADDFRADSAIPANSNVLLVLDDPTAPEEGLAYAMDGDKLYVVPTDDFEVVLPAALEKKAYLMKDDGTLYRLPYLEDGSVALAKGAQGIWTISDCAGYDDDRWLIVSYDGKSYFVSADIIEEDLAPPDDPDRPESPKEPDALYGRAKASRVGGTVDIYSDMSETDVLVSVVDGKKVEILAAYSNYYQVRYGDVVGFMRASEIKIGGLTTVQIVAIVLSVLVLIAGTGIMISIFAIKKRGDDEANKTY